MPPRLRLSTRTRVWTACALLALAGIVVSMRAGLLRSHTDPPALELSTPRVAPPKDAHHLDSLGDALPFGAARPARQADGVDVILITLDATRADYLQPYGSALPSSPFLAALARQGVTFTNAYSTTGWTSPAMASMMTGLYPSEHGVVSVASTEDDRAGSTLPEQALTLAEMLRASGYATFGVCTNLFLTSRFGFAQGFDQFLGDTTSYMPFPRMAVASMRGQMRASNKYFLWVHYFDIHWPYYQMDPWFRQWNDSPFNTSGEFGASAATWLYRKEHGMGADAALPPEAIPQLGLLMGRLLVEPVLAFESIRALTQPPRTQILERDYVRYLRAAYRSQLPAVDADVQHVLQDLEIDDETLLVVTADHGEELLDHGNVGHSMASLYQELIRIPLIIRLPGGRHGGEVIDAPVSIVDLMPTLLELLKITPPEGLSGQSFVGRIDGRTAVSSSAIVSELSHGSGGHYRSLIRYPWKYIARVDAGGNGDDMLFNLEHDPHELHELGATDVERSNLLREWLSDWGSRTQPRWSQPLSRALNDDEAQKLKALGYVTTP